MAKLQKQTVKLEKQAGPTLGAGKVGLERKVRPNFDSMFNPDGMENPLDALPEIDDPQAADEAALSTMYATIKAEKAARREAYRTLIDPEYFCVVCFQNREQKDNFLKAVGWEHLGDKYLDGLAIARIMGVPIEPQLLEAKPVREAPKKLREVEYA